MCDWETYPNNSVIFPALYSNMEYGVPAHVNRGNSGTMVQEVVYYASVTVHAGIVKGGQTVFIPADRMWSEQGFMYAYLSLSVHMCVRVRKYIHA